MTLLRRLARRSLPRTDGTIRLSCLEAPAEVIRDRFGIPHVYAGSRADLARAQGYVHAQDRLFQMETIRRFAFGRLSEVAGPRTLELDRLARRLRLRWAAERDAAACDDEAAALVEAYCEGVNEFVARGPLPLELRLARVPLAPWTPVDVQAPAQMFALTLSGNWENELARMRLAARVGHERARRLDRSCPDGHPVIVPARLAEEGAEALALRRRLGAGASNSWVVAGSRTASGKPILANDPHLLLGIPAVWHAQHVAWDGGEAAGFTVPGAPVVVLGRNRRVAWGMTTALLDTQDLFVERLHPEDPHRYEVEGEWAAADVVREEIGVRGRPEPIVEEVVVTRHGPVVVGPGPGGNEALALRWSAHEPGETTRSLLDLMVAESVAEADRALARFAAPPHNVTLADADGAIAYRLAGRVPRRRSGDGRLPVPGWDSSHEWEGWIPDEELPRFANPERGFIVTANNRIVGDDYPHDLGGEYLSGYRAQRIESLLAEEDALTGEHCRRIQLDRLSLPGLALAAIARTFSSGDPLERTALELLGAWDGDYGPESRGGAVYGALIEKLEQEAYAEAEEDPLVPSAADSWPSGLSERSRPELLRMLAARDDTFFADGRTWDRVFRRALAAAVRELGADPRLWRRGRTHRLRFAHALDAIPVVRRLFSRGPYPVGGDADTVFLLAEAAGAPRGSLIGPSMRAVFDFGDPDGTLVVVAPGQSGHPASRHYDDLIPRWLAGDLVPLALERAKVEEHAEGRLELVPRRTPE